MDPSERDESPMLSSTYLQSDGFNDSNVADFSIRTSASVSTAMNYSDSSRNVNTPLGPLSGSLYHTRNHEAIFQIPQNESKIERYPSMDRMDSFSSPEDGYSGKNENLIKSGQLGLCNDPFCTTCPTYYKAKGNQKYSSASEFHYVLYGDAKGWGKRMYMFLQPYIPGIMNPHARFVQRWNKFFVISCLFAVFLDPLFFFLLSVKKDNKCIVLNWPLTTTMVILRSVTDFIYLIHILLQFRVAYIAPESTVMGAGELVDDPKQIAFNYLYGYFVVDLFAVLPLPQIIILFILPHSLGASGANYAKNLLRAAILVQYIPRLCRFLPLLAGLSAIGLVFESAWANFVINLLTYVLASHVVGSCWYLFGLQRVNQCLRDACRYSNLTKCMEFIDCGHGNDFADFLRDDTWKQWKSNVNASACFVQDGFTYGIYIHAVNLTTRHSVATRYIYSLFWGFQQISTLAGNQVPSYFVWEVIFTMGIIGMGLLFFALLIGNMQNFLQALGRRRLDMSLRRRDVELWMRHRRLPEVLRSQVRAAERFNWAATRGANEEMLMENLPEDMQREIRRHLFKFVKKVRIFQLLNEPIIDAICERLRMKTYIRGSKILSRGCLIDKMVFVVRGKMESIGDDLTATLSEGDVCGEELLTWSLEHSSVNKDGKRIRIPGHRLLCNRLVQCLTNVEAFILRVADIEEVTSLFARFLRSPRVQGAIRYESPYWRGHAARRIQVAWSRKKKRRLSLGETSSVSS